MSNWNLSVLGPSLLGQSQFDYIWDDMINRHWSNATKISAKGYPVTDIFQNEDGTTTVEMALAGFRKEDISVSVQKSKNSITISSKGVDSQAPKDGCRLARRAFTKSFVDTSASLDLENAVAKFENGLLTLTISKTPAEVPVSITVN